MSPTTTIATDLGPERLQLLRNEAHRLNQVAGLLLPSVQVSTARPKRVLIVGRLLELGVHPIKTIRGGIEIVRHARSITAVTE